MVASTLERTEMCIRDRGGLGDRPTGALAEGKRRALVVAQGKGPGISFAAVFDDRQRDGKLAGAGLRGVARGFLEHSQRPGVGSVLAGKGDGGTSACRHRAGSGEILNRYALGRGGCHGVGPGV